jgi:surface protein
VYLCIGSSPCLARRESERRKKGDFYCFGADGFDLRSAVHTHLTDDLDKTEVRNRYGSVIGDWCVDGVESFAEVFKDQADFNEDLSQWNTSSAVNLSGCFRGATQFSQDLSRWDVSSVTDFSHLFEKNAAFESDLSKWQVGKGEDFSFMFAEADAFSSDLSEWDTSNALTLDSMFYECSNFRSNLNWWNTAKVKTMESTFDGAEVFNSPLAWNVGQVTTMRRMFRSTGMMDTDFSSWNVEKVFDMSEMFHTAVSFRGVGLELWKTSSVIFMTAAFKDTWNFNGELGDWDVRNVEDFSLVSTR